jgi:hypothetical protein
MAVVVTPVVCSPLLTDFELRRAGICCNVGISGAVSATKRCMCNEGRLEMLLIADVCEVQSQSYRERCPRSATNVNLYSTYRTPSTGAIVR